MPGATRKLCHTVECGEWSSEETDQTVHNTPVGVHSMHRRTADPAITRGLLARSTPYRRVGCGAWLGRAGAATKAGMRPRAGLRLRDKGLLITPRYSPITPWGW